MSRSGRILVTLCLIFVLIMSSTAILRAYVFPPATSRSGCIQQLGVGGTTLSLSQGQSAFYTFSLNSGQSVHFELKSFIGTFCLYLYDNNWNYITSACSSSPPVTLDYTSSSGGVYFIQVYANSTPYGSSTAELRWSKSHGWFQPDEGTDKSNPMLIYDAGSFCGVEGTLQSGDHWYKYSPSSLSSYAWVVSIWGSSGTDYDLYIYDCNGNRIASAITGSYPDYTYVKTSTSCILINVHPYSTASPYEYDLQVSKPYLVSYSLSSTTVKPGETFTVYYKIYNPLHHSISVVLGASIEDPNGKIIDDPSHDTSVNVQPGTNWFLGAYKIF